MVEVDRVVVREEKDRSIFRSPGLIKHAMLAPPSNTFVMGDVANSNPRSPIFCTGNACSDESSKVTMMSYSHIVHVTLATRRVGSGYTRGV